MNNLNPPVPHPATTKSILRKQLTALRQSMPPAERSHKSKFILDRCLSQPFIHNAHTIFSFVSVRDEVQTHELIQTLLHKNIHVAVPFIDIQKREMHAVWLKDFSHLVPGHYGILEPEPPCHIVSPAEIDITLVPGLGFDESGNRIGYGGGFYDRFLSQQDYGGFNIALAFEAQIIPEIIREPHDLAVDAIITESRMIACKKGTFSR